MLPFTAPEKVSWNPVLITIGICILLAIVSFVVITSQWGRPTTSIATAGFFGILFGILIFAMHIAQDVLPKVIDSTLSVPVRQLKDFL